MAVETSFKQPFVQHQEKSTLAKLQLAIPNSKIVLGYTGHTFGSLNTKNVR